MVFRTNNALRRKIDFELEIKSLASEELAAMEEIMSVSFYGKKVLHDFVESRHEGVAYSLKEHGKITVEKTETPYFITTYNPKTTENYLMNIVGMKKVCGTLKDYIPFMSVILKKHPDEQERNRIHSHYKKLALKLENNSSGKNLIHLEKECLEELCKNFPDDKIIKMELSALDFNSVMKK